MGTFNSSFLQILNGLFKTSLICKCLYGTLLIGFALCCLIPPTLNFFTIVPFNLLKFPPWLWTFVTFWAFESNVILLVNHIICLHIAFTVLESMWELKELVKYFVITNLATGLVSMLIFSSLYLVTGVEKFYFYHDAERFSIRGLAGFDAAVLVALKQTMPDTVIFNTPMGRYKNNHFPLTWIVVTLVLTVLGLLNVVYICMFLVGFYSSWCYLRFYQVHKNDSQGDMTDGFSFASFFPPPFQVPVSLVSGIMYKIALRLKICKPAIRRFDVRQLQSVTVTLPGMDASDAERRKQKALRDLNERLAKAKEQQLPAWDDDASNDAARQPLTHQTSPPPQLGVEPTKIENV